MLLHVVLKSKEELSTLKEIVLGGFKGVVYEDSYIYVKLEYSKQHKWLMGYVLTTPISELLISIEELQQWLLLVSLGCNFEESLCQITGGT